MTTNFTTFIAPTFFATALFAGTAAEAAYVPEVERILDVVAQTGTTITLKACTGEDKGFYGFYQINVDDDGNVLQDELTVCTDQAKGPDYLATIKHEVIHAAQACKGYEENVSGRTNKWLRKQFEKAYGKEGYEILAKGYEEEDMEIELEAYGMENRPAAEIIEVVKDACAFAF